MVVILTDRPVLRMPCCPCMGSTGRCLRCKCVTAGRKCQDCRPSRRNPSRCENQHSANQSLSEKDDLTMSLSKEDELIDRSHYNELDHSNCSIDSLEISDSNAVDNDPIPHVGNLPHYKKLHPPEVASTRFCHRPQIDLNDKPIDVIVSEAHITH